MTFTHKIKKLIAEKVIEDYPRDAHPSLTYSAEFKLSELREPGKKYIITVQEIHPLLKKNNEQPNENDPICIHRTSHI